MENIIILAVAVMAGVAAYSISIFLGKGAVFGSAVVTLISGILFPHFVPTLGVKLAIVATCASYAGMVAVKNVPKLWEMAIVGLITGSMFILTSSAYVGVGGKLGTIAAISCFSWVGLKKVLATVTNPKGERAFKAKVIGR